MIPVRQSIGGLGNLMFKQAYLYSQMRDGLIPDIYVQSNKYFEKYQDEVRQLFGQGIAPGSIDRISLHVRRGDYVNNPFYTDLTETDYYEKAMAEFPDDKFLVFCADRQGQDESDLKWCKERFKGSQFEFNESKDEVEDMNTMANCKGHIMANSSFSWWAAFLGGGKTVCPSKWFTDDVQRVGLLDSWIKI